MSRGMSRNSWDIRFMGLAQHEVRGWSKDPDEKVGCVIVSPDRRRWSGGYNGFPVDVVDTPKRLADKDLKNELTVHAELNAILNARTDLTGWALYSTKAPCLDCAKAIIQAGLDRIVCPAIDASSRWAHNQRRAKQLLGEVGIETTYMAGMEDGL